MSGLVLALFSWSLFLEGASFSEALVVSNSAAIAAGVAFFYGVMSFLFAPREHLTSAGIIGYYLIIVMIALLLKDTGYLSSPFIALWMLAGLFAAVFGIYGAVPIVSGVVIYLGTLYAGNGLDFDAVALSLLLGILPLAIGYLVWRPIGHSQVPKTAEDRSLLDLTDQLDAVSGQSEIVIAAIADGVISVDRNGIVQLINPAAQKMLGWGRSDAVGLDYRSVLKLLDSHDNAPNELNDPVQQALHKQLPTKTENFRLQTADSGKSFVASIMTTPIGDSTSGAIIVFRDITHENEEERQRAEFISTASHEMRTPVASIEGYLGLAMNPSTASIDDKAREYIGKAQDAAKHLGRLFQDLLDVSKADDGRLSDNPTIIDLVPFVHDIMTGQLHAAQAKGLELQYPPQPDFSTQVNAVDDDAPPEKNLSPVFYVNVDADHLREILSNLIENAIKYTHEGTVKVDISGQGEFAIVSVQDSGVGIPKEDQPHLFQKFYRVDNTDTREIGGTGLGLYLARRLAEAIGGTLWVESIYKEGSTFFLKLPRIEASEAERVMKEKRPAQPLQPQSAPPAIAVPPLSQVPPPAPATPTPAPQPAPAQTMQPPALQPIQPPQIVAPVPQTPPAPQAVPLQPSPTAAPIPVLQPPATAPTPPAAPPPQVQSAPPAPPQPPAQPIPVQPAPAVPQVPPTATQTGAQRYEQMQKS